MVERRAFVSMPYGVHDVGGVPIDFGAVFEQMVAPALQAAGFAVDRGERGPTNAQTPFEAMREGMREADCVIVDTTMPGPNRSLEAGVAFGLGKRLVLIGARGMAHEDFGLGLPTHEYAIDAIDPGFAEALRGASLDPDEKAGVVEVEALMRSWRNAAAWSEMVRYYDRLAASVRDDPKIARLAAFALNRRNRSGDRERAVKLLQEILETAGPSGETLGLLGRVHKDRFLESASPEELERAIGAYRRGFEADAADYYPAVNLVTLLAVRNDTRAREEIAAILPGVRAAVEADAAAHGMTYWTAATLLELACIDRAWEEAERYQQFAAALGDSPWEFATTAQNLELLGRNAREEDREQLNNLIGRLRAHQSDLEHRDA